MTLLWCNSRMDDDRYTRITLRIPKDLHAKLQESADATSKSMNAEIIARLERSFRLVAEDEFSHFEQTVLRAVKTLQDHQQSRIDRLEALLHDLKK